MLRVPLLARGVVVHVHDVYLPFDYPRALLWTEQWLLAAFLHRNAAWEVTLPTHWMLRGHLDLFAGTPLHPGGGGGSDGGVFDTRFASSFWMTKIGDRIE